MAVKEKLIEQVKELSAPMTELEKEIMIINDPVAVLNFKLMAAEKRAEHVAYERDGASLQQFQRGQNKLAESINRI